MDLYFQIISFILLWVCGCRCLPKPYHVSNSTSSATQMLPRSLTRSDGGWNPPINNRVNTSGGGSGNRVVFPSDNENQFLVGHHSRVTIPPKPSACKKSSSSDDADSRFCKDENYPVKYLDKLLKKSASEFQALFGSDFVDLDEIKDDTLVPRIDGLGETPLCQTVLVMDYPQVGDDVDGTTRTIVNHGNFTQGIRKELCANVSGPCEFSSIFPNNYVSSCKQKYIYRKLASLNDDQELEWIFFPIPSCCVCMYRPLARVTRSSLTTPAEKINRSKRKSASSLEN